MGINRQETLLRSLGDEVLRIGQSLVVLLSVMELPTPPNYLQGTLDRSFLSQSASSKLLRQRIELVHFDFVGRLTGGQCENSLGQHAVLCPALCNRRVPLFPVRV